jgi:hypothetical protein
MINFRYPAIGGDVVDAIGAVIGEHSSEYEYSYTDEYYSSTEEEMNMELKDSPERLRQRSKAEYEDLDRRFVCLQSLRTTCLPPLPPALPPLLLMSTRKGEAASDTDNGHGFDGPPTASASTTPTMAMDSPPPRRRRSRSRPRQCALASGSHSGSKGKKVSEAKGKKVSEAKERKCQNEVVGAYEANEVGQAKVADQKVDAADRVHEGVQASEVSADDPLGLDNEVTEAVQANVRKQVGPVESQTEAAGTAAMRSTSPPPSHSRSRSRSLSHSQQSSLVSGKDSNQSDSNSDRRDKFRRVPQIGSESRKRKRNDSVSASVPLASDRGDHEYRAGEHVQDTRNYNRHSRWTLPDVPHKLEDLRQKIHDWYKFQFCPDQCNALSKAFNRQKGAIDKLTTWPQTDCLWQAFPSDRWDQMPMPVIDGGHQEECVKFLHMFRKRHEGELRWSGSDWWDIRHGRVPSFHDRPYLYSDQYKFTKDSHVKACNLPNARDINVMLSRSKDGWQHFYRHAYVFGLGDAFEKFGKSYSAQDIYIAYLSFQPLVLKKTKDSARWHQWKKPAGHWQQAEWQVSGT